MIGNKCVSANQNETSTRSISSMTHCEKNLTSRFPNDLVSCKKISRIYIWNVRIMNKLGNDSTNGRGMTVQMVREIKYKN